MAICKHNTSKNGYAAALEYLTMQHDSKGTLLRDAEGVPVPREEYLINGINCIPETFAALCLQDRLRYGKVSDCKTVDTHQYILSFSPEDAKKGLTMDEGAASGDRPGKEKLPGPSGAGLHPP